ncbi:MAG: HD-GYP domain-containing protein [Heliobacteriaceae bacterium]|nr:HD-GYP domain-containing protein [Heliobacteriaceae bacterium]MDD4587778.1 HD-GYP domain-containing protein [Heliobacteriaceae bacterium]
MRETKVSPHYRRGEILATNIFTKDGRLLVPEGTVLTPVIYQDIINWEAIGIIAAPKSPVHGLKKEKPEQILFRRSLETVRNVFIAFRHGQGFQEECIRETTTDIVSAVTEDEQVSLRLSRLWDSDDYTLHHSVDVSLLSTMIGLNLGLTRKELESLATGAILHDIGKIFVPNELLNKKGRLTDPEFAIIKNHTKDGVAALQQSGTRLPTEQLLCILQHHEKCDGTGYPQGLKYAKIHLFARIIAVADIYSALTTNRAYRRRLDHYQAVDILWIQSKTGLDKHIVHVFMERLRAMMLNTWVRLSTGEEGYVVQFHEEAPLRPTVMLTHNYQGQVIVSPYLVDLREKPPIFIEQVLESL